MNFASDNVTGASPEILAALAAANRGPAMPYGADEITRRLEQRFAELFEHDLAVFPVATGTAANSLALACLTPVYGAIYCHEAAHVMTDECGAPEFYTGGAKVIGLPTPDGKLTHAQLEAPLRFAKDMGVHHVKPAALSLTQSTEWGTVYTPTEVQALADAARAHQLAVHMDGSRLANAIAHLGCSPAGITWKAGVDVLCLGATKNGAMAAEAVIFFNRTHASEFESRRKRGGHLWSKMRFLSAQLIAYLEDGLWLRNASHANAMAARLAAGLATVHGVRLVQKAQANELFVEMPDRLIESLLADGFEFYRWPAPAGVTGSVVRLVTSFCTMERDVDMLVEAARR